MKRSLLCSVLILFAVFAANAQIDVNKVLNGTGQYRTWTVGINTGITSTNLMIGGQSDFNTKDMGLGYGLSLRKQVGHVFGVQLDLQRGVVKGHNEFFDGNAADPGNPFTNAGAARFRTKLNYTAGLSGMINSGSIDFTQRGNSLSLFFSAGFGIAAYAPYYSTNHLDGVALSDAEIKKEAKDANLRYGSGNKKNEHEFYVPVGLGARYKLSERVGFVLGYSMNFLDNDNLDNFAANYATKDKWSYGYTGLDFSIGDRSKANLEWVNPVAVMYDELKDPTLRQELEALKNRVSVLEGAISQLEGDTDGDGTANKFDKCQGTEAGKQVDGSGCPIKFP